MMPEDNTYMLTVGEKIVNNDQPAINNTSTPTNLTQLRIATFNIHGFGEPQKRKRIYNHLLANYDIALLQETYWPSDEVLRRLKGTWHESPFIFNNGQLASSGVGIFISPLTKDLEIDRDSIKLDRHGRFIRARITWQNKPIEVISVYAPVVDEPRAQFFSTLMVDLLDGLTDNVILGGDFNCCLHPEKDAMYYRDFRNWTHSRSALTELITQHGLVDVWRDHHPDHKQFTWMRLGNMIIDAPRSRIDRLYISPALTPFALATDIFHLPNVSDHSIANLTLASEAAVPNYKGQYKMNTNILNSPEFCSFVEQLLLHPRNGIRFPHMKELIIKRARRQGIAHAAQEAEKKRTIESTLNILQDTLMLPLNLTAEAISETHKLLKVSQEELNRILRQEAQGAAIRSHIMNGMLDEKCLGFFKKEEKRNASKKSILVLKDEDGHFTNDPRLIQSIASNFYQNLFDHHPTEQAAQDVILRDITCDLDQTDLTILDAPITYEEIEAAIKKLPNGKSPGPDGIPSEFYKHFREQASPHLLDIYTESFDQHKLVGEMDLGTIIPLYKKNDRTEMKNYRPITLSNTDYKILAKVLAERLKPRLHKIIRPTQNGFVPGRHIDDAIRTVQLLIHAMDAIEQDGEETAFLLIDQEKAFDRVNREFLYKCLETFGLPTNFVRWIKTIYASTRARVSVNNHLSDMIYLHSGVRQGCPLSPLLFIIALEPFARALQSSSNYQGITFRTSSDSCTVKNIHFADDTGLAIKGQQDLNEVSTIITTYEKASAAKVNKSKSEMIPLGHYTLESLQTDYKKLTRQDTPKYLGVPIGYSLDLDQVWNTVRDKLICTLSIESQHRLPLYSRSRAAQTYLISRLRYLLNFLPMSKHTTQTLNKLLQNFVLDKERSFLDRTTLQLSPKLGGINMPNLARIKDGHDLKFIQEIVAQDKPWFPILMFIINSSYTPQTVTMNLFKSVRIPIHVDLPPLLIQAIKTFRKHKPELVEPATADRVLNNIINDYVTSKSYMNQGYSQLNDLISHKPLEGKIPLKALNILKNDNRKGPLTRTHNQLQQALPELEPPEYFIQPSQPEKIAQIIDIDDTTVTVIRYPVENRIVNLENPSRMTTLKRSRITNHKEVAIDPKSKRIRTDKLTEPRHYQISIRGNILNMRDFTMHKYIAALRQDGQHRHSNKWNRLDPPPIWEKIPDRNMHPALPKRLYNLRYKIMHDRVPIGRKMAYCIRTTAWNPTECPLCNETDSIEHCYLRCPQIQQLWSHMQELLRTFPQNRSYKLQPQQILFGTNRPDGINSVNDLLISLMQFTIWKTRCKYIHEGLRFTRDQIISQWKSEALSALSTIRHAITQGNYCESLSWNLEIEETEYNLLQQLLSN